MLYIIRRLSDSYYLSSFEEIGKRIQFDFSTLESDALKLPKNMAERYMNVIYEIQNRKCEIIPAK